MQTPAVRQMAQPSNVDDSIARAGTAISALSAARVLLSQAQSDLREQELQFSSTCGQIGVDANKCEVFYLPDARTMLDASRNELVLRRDKVAYLTGMVNALSCRSGSASVAAPALGSMGPSSKQNEIDRRLEFNQQMLATDAERNEKFMAEAESTLNAAERRDRIQARAATGKAISGWKAPVKAGGSAGPLDLGDLGRTPTPTGTPTPAPGGLVRVEAAPTPAPR